MIDTYMDRVDAAQGYKPAASYVSQNDPRHFAGQIYIDQTHRLVAEARHNLATMIEALAWHHRYEIDHGIPVGTEHSIFDARGQQWRA